MILEYIEGRILSEVGLKTLLDEQRQYLYNQLACIYIQLRRLEFSSIGVLSCGPDRIDVYTRLISISLNKQELEASDYVSLLLNIAKNAFEKGKKSFTKEKWIDYTLDNGLFVLAHGDLEPYNIIEWSRVVPLQFFMPPTWLIYRGTNLLALPLLYIGYVKELDKFRQVTEMDYFVARYLDWFMDEDLTRRAIVERKTRDFMAYCVELKSLGITDATKQILSRFTSGRSSFLLVARASYLVWKYARRNPSIH
ncbi:hypothetical protein BKA61DRAFT_609701 [Leptodontidium sp. MPI-SDFR-AT-0119]|nr:hypothetical protein BKA61DRAFT_609701 [Leptodontidium sp. MPI-SDFR-AT-0119]